MSGISRKGEQVGPVLKHAATVLQAAFGPNEINVVTASADGLARTWDLTPDRIAIIAVWELTPTSTPAARRSGSGPTVVGASADKSRF